MPWLLAISIKIFGISSATVNFPAILFSILSVHIVYLLSKLLVDKHFGLIAMLVLTLHPQFIKDGRNPMLETALMFFSLLAIYLGIKGPQSKNIKTICLRV